MVAEVAVIVTVSSPASARKPRAARLSPFFSEWDSSGRAVVFGAPPVSVTIPFISTLLRGSPRTSQTPHHPQLWYVVVAVHTQLVPPVLVLDAEKELIGAVCQRLSNIPPKLWLR